MNWLDQVNAILTAIISLANNLNKLIIDCSILFSKIIFLQKSLIFFKEKLKEKLKNKK